MRGGSVGCFFFFFFSGWGVGGGRGEGEGGRGGGAQPRACRFSCVACWLPAMCRFSLRCKVESFAGAPRFGFARCQGWEGEGGGWGGGCGGWGWFGLRALA